MPAGKASWKREALSWTLCLGRIWRKNEETRAESQDFGVTKSNPVLNHLSSVWLWVFPVVLVVKILPAHAGDLRDAGSIPGSGRSPGGRNSNPLQYSCLEKSHEQKSLAGYSPKGHKELNTTEQTHVCMNNQP